MATLGLEGLPDALNICSGFCACVYANANVKQTKSILLSWDFMQFILQTDFYFFYSCCGASCFNGHLAASFYQPAYLLRAVTLQRVQQLAFSSADHRLVARCNHVHIDALYPIA